MNKRLEQVIFNFINEKNFIIKETPDNYYFLENEDYKYSQIRVIKNDMVCYVFYELLKEIELFFSLTRTDSKDVLTRYVENTLNIKVSYTPEGGTNTLALVENTLNIKVSYTFTTIDGNTPSVENTLNINPSRS